MRSQVVLALNGRMSRAILSRWLLKIGVPIWEANEWNELTRVLQELFKPARIESLSNEGEEMAILIIVINIGMLNISTDIWKEQLNFLDAFSKRAKFGWILNHDTSNTIKIELRRRGHLLMVNGPLYKTKLVQIIEAIVKERNVDQPKKNIMWTDAQAKSSNVSEITETNSTESSQIEESNQENFTACGSVVSNCFPELTEVRSEWDRLTSVPNGNLNCEQQIHQVDQKVKNGQKALEGLHILLAEDNPILQRVTTIMLEQVGAKVVVVGDGVQAVEALSIQKVESFIKSCDPPPFDLILMDCQVRMSLLTDVAKRTPFSYKHDGPR